MSAYRRSAVLALFCGVTLAAVWSGAGITPVRAQERAPRFTVERSVSATAPGPHRIAVDVPLLAQGRPFRIVSRGDRRLATGGLADLRFFDAEGRPVPHILVDPPPGEPQWIAAQVLPVAPTKKTSGFEADLESPAQVDMIRVEGLPAPFLKRVVLEGSGDRERWTMLAAEGTLFDLPEDRLRQTSIGFAAGPYRYLRVTWDDTHSGRVPAPTAVFVRRAASVPPAPVRLVPLTVERRPSEPGRSRYRIKLPGARFPAVALEIDAGGGHVYRQAGVYESRFSGGAEAIPALLGQGALVRVVRDGITAAALRVPIAAPNEAEIDLVVDDGANAPLEIRGVSAELAQLPWIYLEAPAGAFVARYGDPRLDAPTFDLEAVRTSLEISAVPEGKWGEPKTAAAPEPAPEVPMPEAGAPIDAATFRHARRVDDGEGGLVAMPLDGAVVARSKGPHARFADVRILDAANRQIPYLLERLDEPLSIDVSIAPASDVKSPELRSTEPGRRSIYAIALPYPNLPAARLVVETGARVFDRTIRLGVEHPPDRRHRSPWLEVVATMPWRHADQQRPAAPLTIGLPTTPGTSLLLVVDEGDNAPLPIASARVLLPGYRLRFFHPRSTGLRLVYGRDDLPPPRYDLALLAPQVMGASAREVKAAAAETAAGERPAAPQLLSPQAFWILLGASVLVLLALIVRLVRA